MGDFSTICFFVRRRATVWPLNSQDRRTADRRRADTAPPTAQERRLQQRRRPTENIKPACPWCGNPTSSVIRSGRSDYTTREVTNDGTLRTAARDRYQRRRQCAECDETFPTTEALDRERFANDLKRRGMTLTDLGLD
jgi:hypothetical protein